jgi:hypothetical protein
VRVCDETYTVKAVEYQRVGWAGGASTIYAERDGMAFIGASDGGRVSRRLWYLGGAAVTPDNPELAWRGDSAGPADKIIAPHSLPRGSR